MKSMQNEEKFIKKQEDISFQKEKLKIKTNLKKIVTDVEK